ncbi:MAG: O-antigen ligase family protein [Syntrophaceae bacterium]|nr:O-antigen ligase family protein [Syntrophaceae bacterium]
MQELTKYLALHIVILFGISLPLTPLSRTKKAWILYTAILLFLVIGCFWSIAHGYKDPRMKGFLPNPNTFALTAMMLLLLTNGESSRSSAIRASHLVAITLLFLARTSGALIGYVAGFIHLNLFAKKGNLIKRSVILAVSISLIIILFTAMPNDRFEAIDMTRGKIAVIEKNYSRVLSGKEINFYSIVERQGVDNTSGLWRLYQWHRILTLFFSSSLDKIMFGYGIGTTDILFKQKAHNDYIRILFETGLIGLILNLIVWGVLYRRMAIKYRWIVIAIAVFCFTENNYDHFPAMSLLALYMISAGKPNIVDESKQGKGEKKRPQVMERVSASVS